MKARLDHTNGASALTSAVATARKREALELFAPLPRYYDRVAAVLSFGQDPRWRRAMVGAVGAKPGERVLDVVGLDQSPQMLAGARLRLEQDRGLEEHVTLVSGEAERMPFAHGEFDHLTFTYLLCYVDDPPSAMRELARVVRPGGRVASLEFAMPGASLWRALWRAYARVGLPALGRLVSREWAEMGRFLAWSIPDFCERHPIGQIIEMWRGAGIGDVEVKPMSLGAGLVMWGTKYDGSWRFHRESS
ncbi:MAG: class I SAM-dependent methyltransferase [Spirochaetia bacterium]|jgi:demethylmenaquinone methyltransferase/2-methoxy-6-polyprenyl-1,4-benzoquinol methylase